MSNVLGTSQSTIDSQLKFLAYLCMESVGIASEKPKRDAMLVEKLPEEIKIKDEKVEKEIEAAVVDGSGTEAVHLIGGDNGQAKQMNPENRGCFSTMLCNNDEFVQQTSSDDYPNNEAVEQSIASVEIRKKTRNRTQNFSKEEDLILISGYLNTGKEDSFVGNQQKQDAFWVRVHSYFHKEKNRYPRSRNSLMSRWGVINKDVDKFVECYAQVLQLQQSGMTEQDMILHAKDMFHQTMNKRFQLDHCWNVMKNHERWSITKSSQHTNKSSKKHIGASPQSSSPATTDSIVNPEDDDIAIDDFERPIVKKATKEIEEKEKVKDHVPNSQSSASLLQQCTKDYAQAQVAIRERYEKIFHYQEEYLAVEKQKAEAMHREVDIKIMMIDTSGMDEVRSRYFKKLQEDIFNKMS